MTAKATTSMPISVSTAYAAALVVQNASGANSTQTPTAAVIHCIHIRRRDIPASAKKRIRRPEPISLTPSHALRISGRGISCPSAGGTDAATGSNNP